MINIHLLEDEGIILVEPVDALEKADFEKLATEIDSFPAGTSSLTGLIIHTKLFPGWDDFNAFLHHMKFVKDHHKRIQHLAIVTDSRIGAIGPSVANLFVSAKLKHFPFNALAEAKEWVLND